MAIATFLPVLILKNVPSAEMIVAEWNFLINRLATVKFVPFAMARTMNNKQIKNGVNTLYPYKEKEKEEILKRLELWKFVLSSYNGPYWKEQKEEAQEFVNKLEQELKRIRQEQEKYLQLEAEYYDLLETKHQLETDKNHPLLGKINIRLNQLDTRLKRNEASEKYYPIKDYLLENSYLVQFKEKEASGKSLSKTEKAKQNRIHDLRDKVFSNIKKELVKYYQAVIKGDYRFDGMPEIKGGIRDWAEAKIWHLLVRLGEPNHFCDLDKTNDFWAEAE